MTDLFTAAAQHQITDQLDQRWAAQSVAGVAASGPRPPRRAGLRQAVLPTLGEQFTVVEGTTQPDLAEGPAHYRASLMPGEPGDVAIAGHRVGRDAPFLDSDQLRSCDPLVIETGGAWLVFRVLPHADELSDWATGHRALRRGGRPGDRYSGHVGVVATVPDHPDARPVPPPALLTLTTCSSKFSAHQRLVIHAVLAARYSKDPHQPARRPAELRGS